MTTTVIDNREFRSDAPYRIPIVTDVELRRCTFSMCQQPGGRSRTSGRW